MTSLNMWRLLPLTVLTLLSITPTESKVVELISDCQEFLFLSTPPNIAGIIKDSKVESEKRYKIICQMYDGKKRFMTVYDTDNKIPVFSAYKFKVQTAQKSPQRPPWMMEPQLEEDSSTDERSHNMRQDNDRYRHNHQASNQDYQTKEKTMYNRGHLFPFSYGFDESDKMSTCTLTNIVPQAVSFNSGSWQKMENCVKCFLEKYCINNNNNIEAHLVTGAKSGHAQLNNRVNIPSVLWSAFCCYSKSQNKWLASAFWGNNAAENPGENLKPKSLKDLNATHHIEAFPRPECPQSETVAALFPKDKHCQC